MREAFLAEAQWTRFYAIAAQGSERTVAFGHLTASEDAIAASVGTYAGQDAQNQLAALLQQRAQLFAALVAPSALRGVSMENQLFANDAAIARFFGQLGAAWNETAIKNELDAQLQATIDGIRLRGQDDELHAASSFDVADEHTIALGDLVATGLIQQFPDGFAPATTTPSDDDFRLRMRVALDEHAFWMRVFVVDRMANRNAQPALDRVASADVDFGKLFGRFYGDTVAGQAEHYLHTDATDATAFMFSLEMNDQSAVDGTSKQWDADAEQLAQFLVATTPSINLADAQSMTHANADRERSMIIARFSNQWDADAANYDMIVVNIDSLGDLVATSITTSRSQPH